MRYFPMMLAAGLLSAGLLAGSGPAHAMPMLALDRSPVADTQVEKVAYYHPGDTTAVAITAIAMATTAHIMATATDGPIMVMAMGVAGVTERGRNTNSNSRVQ